MNVLSLFDGMSCGRIALERAGIEVKNYYTSEIDRHASLVAYANYPHSIRLGCVKNVSADKLEKIDLIIGGSPCQGFSFAGKQLNFNDPRSALFFEFVRVLEECKKINHDILFMLENVNMKKEYQDVISGLLGVDPIEINSSLVSAQNRKRLYWTNIPGIEKPEDRGILLSDILDLNTYFEGFNKGDNLNKATILGRRLNNRGVRDDYNKAIPITQCLEVRASNVNKSNCLTTVEKDNVLTTFGVGRHKDAFRNKLPFRYYTLEECCRLQTVPIDYFYNCASENQAKKMLGNGWTVDVIAHIFSYIKK